MQSSTLNASNAPPYARPSASARPQGSATRDTGGSVATKPPTGQRSSTTSRGSTGDSARQDSTIATRPDAETPTPTPGGGFDPQLALTYVLDTYRLNGVEFENESALKIIDLYRSVQRQGSIYHTTRPVIGDLVFFHNTYDANRDGRNNDWYSHVGIVEEVHRNGTIVVLSYRNGQVVRDAMNLERKREHELNGQVINAQLRANTRQDPDYTQYLSGELFAGFGSVLGDMKDVAVIDAWSPRNR